MLTRSNEAADPAVRSEEARTGTPAHRPVGGIEAVALLPATHVEAVTFEAGRCTAVTPKAGAQWVEWPILEDCADYTEEHLCEEGNLLTRHTLRLQCDPEEVRGSFAALCEMTLAGAGVVARIETAAGVTLLVGWSERFGCEQPLRLHSARCRTEAAPLDAPRFEAVLVSEDTAPAAAMAR